MNVLDDPSIKEIIDDFCQEATTLFMDLNKSLEKLEERPDNPKELEKFGQIIDRVMGAAKSIGATEIATFCELGKTIGYKSSQTNDLPLLNVVVAILYDTVDILDKMIKKLKTGNSKALESLNTEAFASRLRWLSEKFKNIERSSCKIDQQPKILDQNSIDDLIASLGL